MKRHTAAAMLLTAMLLCTGCTGQTGTASVPDEPPAVTGEPIETAESETVTEAPDSADASLTDSAAQPDVTGASAAEDTAPAVTVPPPDYSTGALDPYETVTIEGDFNATVRALMPDYVNDEETVRAAVLQLFQDIPFFIILSPEICEQLEVGGNYLFHIPEQEITTEKTNLFEDGTLSPDAIVRSYVRIDSFRAPQEGEYGLDSWFVTYQHVS